LFIGAQRLGCFAQIPCGALDLMILKAWLDGRTRRHWPPHRANHAGLALAAVSKFGASYQSAPGRRVAPIVTLRAD
jgi:hypothetical protein